MNNVRKNIYYLAVSSPLGEIKSKYGVTSVNLFLSNVSNVSHNSNVFYDS